MLPVGVVLTLWLLVGNLITGTNARSLTFTELVKEVGAGQVQSVNITPDGQVEGGLKNGDNFESAIPTAVPDQRLARLLENNNVQVPAVPEPPSVLGFILNLAPLLLFIGLFVYMGRRAGGQLAGAVLNRLVENQGGRYRTALHSLRRRRRVRRGQA